MTIIRELYLHQTKVIFMLKRSIKLRRYIYLMMWQHVCNGKVCFKLMQIFIHLVVCLTAGPKPLPNRALHIVSSRAGFCERRVVSFLTHCAVTTY